MKALFWIGWVLIGIGAMLILGNVVAYFMGMGASYNFGDPTQFEFILVPFWQLGLGALIPGLILRFIAKKNL